MGDDVGDVTVARLHAEQPRFDWVGAYWLEGDEPVLAPTVQAAAAEIAASFESAAPSAAG